MSGKRVVLVFLWISSFCSVFSQDSIPPIAEKLLLDIPLAEYPYARHAAQSNFRNRKNLTSIEKSNTAISDYFFQGGTSMQQSLAVTKSFHNVNYYFNNVFWNKKIKPVTQKRRLLNRLVSNVSAGAIDYVVSYQLMIFSPVWNHEEFHRTGLTLEGIGSHNDTYFVFGGGAAGGSVSRVFDEDLIRFKAKNPVGLVRSFEAGVESEYLLLRNMQKDNFFSKTNYPNVILNILLTKHAIGYVNEFKNKRYDSGIDTLNTNGRTIKERDYVGLDFTPWVYDLFRPNEPYTSRGVHPNGVGIDRAVKRSKLTPQEDKYLSKMGRLQYLNLLSPFLIGINRIKINRNLDMNFAVRHLLTSFGYDLTTDLFLFYKKQQWMLSVHSYHNKSKVYSGVEISRKELAIPVSAKTLSADLTVMGWMQPENESFYSTKTKAGGLLQANISYPLSKSSSFYLEFEGKTDGWVAGNPYLKSNLSTRAGIKFSIIKNH